MVLLPTTTVPPVRYQPTRNLAQSCGDVERNWPCSYLRFGNRPMDDVQQPTNAIEIIWFLGETVGGAQGFAYFPRLFSLGSETGNALSRRNHAGGCHLRAGYLLDLTGWAGSVVNLDALPEP